MTFTELARRIEAVNFNEVMKDVLETHQEEVKDLNREQMLQGRNKDGSFINPPYRPATVAIKAAKGQENRFVTLRDTNSFQSKMTLILKGSTFDMSSTDEKTDMLIGKYGNLIFGLTDQNKSIFMRNTGQSAFVRIVSRETGIKTK